MAPQKWYQDPVSLPDVVVSVSGTRSGPLAFLLQQGRFPSKERLGNTRRVVAFLAPTSTHIKSPLQGSMAQSPGRQLRCKLTQMDVLTVPGPGY